MIRSSLPDSLHLEFWTLRHISVLVPLRGRTGCLPWRLRSKCSVMITASADFLFLFKIYLFLFYVHWRFACMRVCGRVSDPLEVGLQTVVSHYVDAGN